MTKELWLNLPVKDLQKSKEFFTKIGFKFDKNPTDEMAAMKIGTKQIAVMLCTESLFSGFIKGPVSDTSKGSEIIISFDAESREEIDELAKKVTDAGGTLFGEPAESQGWLYGFGFTDLDGHKWNGLYMDFGKLPKK